MGAILEHAKTQVRRLTSNSMTCKMMSVETQNGCDVRACKNADTEGDLKSNSCLRRCKMMSVETQNGCDVRACKNADTEGDLKSNSCLRRCKMMSVETQNGCDTGACKNAGAEAYLKFNDVQNDVCGDAKWVRC